MWMYLLIHVKKPCHKEEFQINVEKVEKILRAAWICVLAKGLGQEENKKFCMQELKEKGEHLPGISGS